MSTTMAATHARPRALVLRNEIKNAARTAGAARQSTARQLAVTSEPTDPPLASSGDIQLINYYKPALEGGVYTIRISQQIEVPKGAYPASTNNIDSGPDNPGIQRFNVVAPRFSIDPSDVHSTYPPQGHADQPMILPHIVFNDPHVPWERSVSTAEEFADDDVMPWLALAPFDINGPDTEQELRLTAEQLAAVYTPSDGSDVKQSTTATVQMPLSQYLQLESNASSNGMTVHIPPFSKDLDWANLRNDTTPVQVIFLSRSLFNGLFQSRTNPAKLDVSQYRYCAHVRNINTQGMADSGVEDTGLFSILHSLRTGPTDIAPNTTPRTQAVHLLNLEYVEQMDMPADDDVVALVSLYSWTYLCQPPLSVNFVDAMRHIGDQIKNETSLLRYSDSMLAQLSSDASQGPFQSLADPSEAATVRTVMTERFTNGYSLVRHRTAPGQVTAAFTRSPLAPVIVPRPDALPAFSNNGQDYQILDPRIGIMDISYSTAFQFGKTLASADMGFVAALMRIRGNVHSAGAAAADTAVADPAVTSTTKMAVMNDLPTVAGNIVQLSKGSTRANTPTLKGRWRQARKPVAKTIRDVNDPAWKNAYVAGVRDRMTVLASASHLKDTGTPNARIPSFAQPSTTVEATTDSTVPYNDLTSPISTDWAFLFNWIMDKLFLDTIPVHYLITDPAHLPTESIRFFHIDPTWLDCMIDGALSVANHLSNDDDVIRQFIKVEINRYLSTPIGSGPTAHLPQVPLYGFFLRSAVVKVFPDLQLTIPYPDVEGVGLAPILVQKRMASDILMVLLDRLPDGGQISSIRFTQPMHQQCFSAGDSLDDNAIEFLFRKIYRTTASQAAAHDALHEFGKPHSWSRTDTSSNAYDWTSRCLNFAKVEEALFRSTDGLVAAMPTEWGPPVQPLLTSSMAGVQLNDTVKYLEIRPAQNIVTSPPGIALPRQIYAGSTSTISTTLRESSRPSTAKLLASSSIKTGASSLQTQSALPVVTQQLPKPLLRSSAKIQPRSLTKTPPQLNTITGPNAVPKMAPDPGSSSSSSKASGAGIMPGAQGLGNVGVGSTTIPIPIPSNPFPYPPPLPQASQFQYAIYPSTFVYSKSILPTLFVNTTNPFPPDIVFSITLNSPALLVNQTLQLHEIDFRIPIGDPSLRKKVGSDILGGVGLVPVNSSPGSAARMLSNQRWVVHVDVQPTYVNLRVIPRTLNLSVPVGQNTSLSFRLNEVEIAGPTGKNVTSGVVPVFVNFTVTEVYGFYADGDKRTKWVNQGSAFQQMALQRK